MLAIGGSLCSLSISSCKFTVHYASDNCWKISQYLMQLWQNVVVIYFLRAPGTGSRRRRKLSPKYRSSRLYTVAQLKHCK